jgi:hypothetical protein
VAGIEAGGSTEMISRDRRNARKVVHDILPATAARSRSSRRSREGVDNRRDPDVADALVGPTACE